MVKQFFEYILSRFIRKDHLFDLRVNKGDWGFVDEFVDETLFLIFKNRKLFWVD